MKSSLLILQQSCLIIIITMFCVSCSGGSDQPNVDIHPMEERLPYGDAEPVLVNRDQILTDSGVPAAEVRHLTDFLEGRMDTPVLIDEMVRSATGAGALNVDQRLILYHIATDRVFEYDIETEQTTDLGRFGRGPGDVAFVTDLVIADTDLYLTREDFTVAVLGRNIRGATDKSIYVYNIEGELQHAFGDLYRSGNQYLQSVMLQGRLRSSREHELYLLTYTLLPYLYIFEADGDLRHLLQFEDFEQNSIEYSHQTGRISGNYTGAIRLLSKTEHGEFIVQVSTDMHHVEPGDYPFDRVFDFYLVNADSGEASYIGQYHHKGEDNISIQVNRLGVVVNEGGQFRFYEG